MTSKLGIVLVTISILGIIILGVGFLNIDSTFLWGDLSDLINSNDENNRGNNKINKSQNITNDSDNDGLNDEREVKIGTDPSKKDTDGDGLNDKVEVIKYDSNPSKKDTDGDGLNDKVEVIKYDSNPSKKDTDGDGLNDKVEVIKYDSNPTKKDTIENGLNDSEQVSYGLRPKENPRLSRVSDDIKSVRMKKLPQDPSDAEDSDSDGYSDYLEQRVSELDENRKDVVVEITWVENTEPRLATLINVRESYLNSPVDNSSGVNMIFYLSGEVNASSRIDGSYLNNYYYKEGYNSTISHYVLFTKNITRDSREINGITSVREPASALASNEKERLVGWAFMHEMGHSLGILESTYNGVDKSNNIESYPSVMNYESLGSCLGNLSYCYQYSSGVGNDDWKTIEDNLESGSVIPNSNYNPNRK